MRIQVTRGFSLVEIMAVMILLALLGTIAVGTYNSQVNKGKVRAATAQISSFETNISIFELECGFLPTSLDDLISPPTTRTCRDYPKEGFLRKSEIPKDPWGNFYFYDPNGSRSGYGYDLWSNGPDGEEGTDDDITNWSSGSND